MTTTAPFFAVVDRLDVARHGESKLLAALKRSLKQLSRAGLEEFQRSLDLVLRQARTAELWGAANLVHAPLDPQDFDAFAAWLACQGSYNFTRALKHPDTAIETLTRAGKRRRRPLFKAVLELAAQVYAERFDADLYQVLGPQDWGRLPLPASPDGEPDERWPHPAALERSLPQLWEAFATRGLRIFPLVEDLSDVCACCGRVHAYVFGLMSQDGEPVASYTLHWVEGEWTRVQSMVHLDSSHEFFALEHHLEGNESGSSLLDPNEAPFTPEFGTLLGRDAALNHAQFPLVAELAQLSLERDPNARHQLWLWQRRQQLAPVLKQRLEGLPAGRSAAAADETEIACQQPDELLALSAWQRRFRLRGDSEELVLDGRRRFRRGVLPVPVRARSEPYCYGVWVEQLDPSAGTDVLDKPGKLARLQRGPRGMLANDLLFFPESTLGLETRIVPGNEGARPSFQLDEQATGPLAREQRKGMAARRPRQLMALFR